MCSSIAERIRQEGGEETHKEHEGDVDKPFDEAQLRILIWKEKEIGEGKNRGNREVENAAADKGSQETVGEVARIGIVRKMKEAGEPLSDRGERNEEADQHRDDKRDGKVNGQVGPINMR